MVEFLVAHETQNEASATDNPRNIINNAFFSEVSAMFHTYPDAEQPVPRSLLSPGEKTWRWIELSLQIPYYVLSFVIDTEQGPMTLQYMLIDVSDVLNLIATYSDEMQDIKLGLLSPGYMNGTNFYQFGQVKQIWRSKDGRELFLMDDGTKLYFLETDEVGDFDGELLLAV